VGFDGGWLGTAKPYLALGVAACVSRAGGAWAGREISAPNITDSGVLPACRNQGNPVYLFVVIKNAPGSSLLEDSQ
jgi:hypothetical protein